MSPGILLTSLALKDVLGYLWVFLEYFGGISKKTTYSDSIPNIVMD